MQPASVYTAYPCSVRQFTHAYAHTQRANKAPPQVRHQPTSSWWVWPRPAQPRQCPEQQVVPPPHTNTSQPASRQPHHDQTCTLHAVGVCPTRPVSFLQATPSSLGCRVQRQPTRFKPQRVDGSASIHPTNVACKDLVSFVKPHSWQSILQLCPDSTAAQPPLIQQPTATGGQTNPLRPPPATQDSTRAATSPTEPPHSWHTAIHPPTPAASVRVWHSMRQQVVGHKQERLGCRLT